MNGVDKLLLFLIGGAGITSLFLGIYAFLNDYHRALSRFFTYLTIVSSIWILANFLIWFYPNIFLVQSAFASGALVVAFGLIWILFLTEERLDYRKIVPIFLMGIFLLLVSYVDGLILRNVTKIRFTSFEGELGNMFWVYFLFVLAAFITIFFKLFIGYRKSAGLRKTQLKYILVGSSLFIFTSFMVSFLLPALGYKNFAGLDSISSLFFTGFIFLAMFRYKFLNPKVIAVALLVFALWLISLTQIFLVVTLREQVINTAILVLVVFFGIFIIRSVIKEVGQREKLEVLTRELSAANERLIKLDKLKSEFLSFASHQVKTPITVVKGYASLIADGTYGPVSSKVKEVSLKIVGASDRMVSLVNNILSLRKIEEGKMEFRFSDVNIVDLVRAVVNELQSVAERKGLSLKTDLSEEKLVVKADEEKFRQVIQNLIDNAVKYTDEGWIEVSVERENNSALISVGDSGRGISAELLPRLFEQWTRDSKTTKGIQGTGLGLYIAKEIISAHGGDIWAESRGEGAGSTFYVRLTRQ